MKKFYIIFVIFVLGFVDHAMPSNRKFPHDGRWVSSLTEGKTKIIRKLNIGSFLKLNDELISDKIAFRIIKESRDTRTNVTTTIEFMGTWHYDDDDDRIVLQTEYKSVQVGEGKRRVRKSNDTFYFKYTNYNRDKGIVGNVRFIRSFGTRAGVVSVVVSHRY